MKKGSTRVVGYFSQGNDENIGVAASICGILAEDRDVKPYDSAKAAYADFLRHEKRKPKAVYKVVLKRVK